MKGFDALHCPRGVVNLTPSFSKSSVSIYYFVKLSYYFFVLALAAVGQPVLAQASRDLAEARTLYSQANGGPTGTALRTALAGQTKGFYGKGEFQPGALRTFDGRFRPVPGLRYHPGLRLLEAQDSISLDSTHLWPVGSLRGFEVGEAGGTGINAPHRFRPRLVKEGSTGTRREYVEVLTAIDAGPLLLAWLYASGNESNRSAMVPLLVVGPGTATTEPLRPLELTQAAVLKLFGNRVAQVASYALGEKLTFDRPADVAHMIDYYNRVAVVK